MEKAGPQRGYQAAAVRMEDRWLGILDNTSAMARLGSTHGNRPHCWSRQRSSGRRQKDSPTQATPCRRDASKTLGSLLHQRAARVQSCHRASSAFKTGKLGLVFKTWEQQDTLRLFPFHFLLALQRPIPVDATTTPHPRVAMVTPVSGAVEGLPVTPCSSLHRPVCCRIWRFRSRAQTRRRAPHRRGRTVRASPPTALPMRRQTSGSPPPVCRCDGDKLDGIRVCGCWSQQQSWLGHPM